MTIQVKQKFAKPNSKETHRYRYNRLMVITNSRGSEKRGGVETAISVLQAGLGVPYSAGQNPGTGDARRGQRRAEQALTELDIPEFN